MKPVRNPLVAIVFWMVIGLLYLPLLNLIMQAFLVDPRNIGSGFSTIWLRKLFASDAFWRPLVTSIEIGVLAATTAVAVATFGAVGLSRVRSTLPPAVQTLILLPILLPEVITGLSLLIFFLLIRVELGFFTVVLAHASFSASFVYFILVEQLRKLDPQMEEAAQDLGARGSQIFWKVTFPNIIPGLMGGWLLAFTLSFDDFLISFFTSGAGLTTLPLKIYSMMRIGISPELNALSFVMICISFSLVITLLSKEQGREWVLKSS
ncbi:MAG: ABC transporter permease [Deltaproteobacteria bacterium]|nr:ABC transporter permease [Deltaproteobacteria bacterium]MBI3293449.1 ABC transporter permease [Deltaproteobacteria bacterium]